MRRKMRKAFKITLQIGLWLLILYLGINIIVKGTQIIYGESLNKIVADTLNQAGKQLGVEIMKKSGTVFSYLYEGEEQEDYLSRFLEKMYLWRADVLDKDITYPIEDSVYDEILARLLIENMFADSSLLNNNIPVISYFPNYGYSVIGEGDSGEISEQETTTQAGTIIDASGTQTEEVVEVLAPEIIGTEYSMAQLGDFDFLLRKFYAVESNTTVNSSILNVLNMLSKDMSLEKSETASPQILIYHTHSTEGYADSREGVVEDTVVGMGNYLAEILERDYGYEVLHVTTPFDCLNGKLDRSTAYAYAEGALDGILATYPDIEVIIDLHRDGVDEDVHLVTEYNGKKAAKIMFVNGISRMENRSISYLNNPNLSGNLAFSFQLQLKGEAYFPGLMRRIIIKAYRYNLHFEPRSVLVELGAQTNTVEEARNSVELLAIMLGEVLR